MARVLKGSHSFTCTHRVHPLTEWTIPAFALPAEAGVWNLLKLVQFSEYTFHYKTWSMYCASAVVTADSASIPRQSLGGVDETRRWCKVHRVCAVHYRRAFSTVERLPLDTADRALSAVPRPLWLRWSLRDYWRRRQIRPRADRSCVERLSLPAARQSLDGVVWATTGGVRADTGHTHRTDQSDLSRRLRSVRLRRPGVWQCLIQRDEAGKMMDQKSPAAECQ